MAVFWLYVMMVTVFGGGREVGALWWPFSSDELEENAEPAAPVAPREPVTFEMANAEQKFLAEAQEYVNLSPLEACQHQVCVCRGGLCRVYHGGVCHCLPLLQVVYQLRQSCGAMGEEELGKMAVALLNCQSKAENRPTFPCTPHMVRLLLPQSSV